jgi:hypothetical protein
MEKLEDSYKSPTDKQVMEAAYAPGIFAAKCRKCKEIIRGTTIEELNKHKCQN